MQYGKSTSLKACNVFVFGAPFTVLEMKNMTGKCERCPSLSYRYTSYQNYFCYRKAEVI